MLDENKNSLRKKFKEIRKNTIEKISETEVKFFIQFKLTNLHKSTAKQLYIILTKCFEENIKLSTK